MEESVQLMDPAWNDELSVQQSYTSLDSALADIHLFLLSSWISEGQRAELPDLLGMQCYCMAGVAYFLIWKVLQKSKETVIENVEHA